MAQFENIKAQQVQSSPPMPDGVALNGCVVEDQEASSSNCHNPHNHHQILVHPNTSHATDVYFEFLKVEKRLFNPVKKLPKVKRDRDRVRFVCISDTHSQLERIIEKIPPGDILIHAGDFTYNGSPLEVEKFNEALGKLPHKYKIVIAGNHELSFTPEFKAAFGHAFDEECRKLGVSDPRELLTSCIYLEDSLVEVYGYKIYGSPWQPFYCGWAFNVRRGQTILEKWNKVPEGVDILVTHGPPLGHGDLAKTGVRAGCVELLNTVEKRVRSRAHVFGHIHEGYGITTNGETYFINCSVCTKYYEPSQEPIVFDFPLKPGIKK